jgi:hypothetical protein
MREHERKRYQTGKAKASPKIAVHQPERSLNTESVIAQRRAHLPTGQNRLPDTPEARSTR